MPQQMLASKIYCRPSVDSTPCHHCSAKSNLRNSHFQALFRWESTLHWNFSYEYSSKLYRNLATGGQGALQLGHVLLGVYQSMSDAPSRNDFRLEAGAGATRLDTLMLARMGGEEGTMDSLI